MNAWTRRAALALFVVFLLLSMGGGLAYYLLWHRYENASAVLEPRIERFEGLVKTEANLAAALQGANQTVETWMHQGGVKAQNGIQQQLRQLMGAAGVTVVATQAAFEPADDQRFARIRLTATVTGEWASAVQLLESLQMQKPPFWVRSAVLARENGTDTAEPQLVRMTLQIEAPVAEETPP
jgi:general secretion pathway protein M